MLNKLLKKCMPWMDKGRWYHVEYEFGANHQFTYIKYDNIFDSHQVNDRDYSLELHVSNNYPKIVIKDYKFMKNPTRIDPTIIMPNDFNILPSFIFDDNGEYVTDRYLIFPNVIGRVECWIYITEV